MSSSDIPDKYPLVGKQANPPGSRRPVSTSWIRPPDAEWLPESWESWAYPKGCEGSSNAEAVLQWLDCMIGLYLEGIPRARKMQSERPDDSMVKGFPTTDRGAAVRDAFRLVRQLGKTEQWADAPSQPDRMFSALPGDREAAAEELRRVRRWVEENKGRVRTDNSYHVTLSQAAAVVSRGKRTLERWAREDPEFPLPDVDGGGGKPNEWKWTRLRPYLEAKTERNLPEWFPSDPLRPDFGDVDS